MPLDPARAAGLAADRARAGPGTRRFQVPAAAVDVALLARLQPGVLLARPGLAGLHLAADLGAVRSGEHAAGVRAAGASLEQLGDETFAEYYHPETGEPLGSLHQSWTAAVALDWLLDED